MSDSRLLKLRFASDPNLLRMVRDQVKNAAVESGCDSKVTSELVIAVNEACMNIMQHAYKGDSSGEIILEIIKSGSELEIRLRDFADPVDLSLIRPRRLEELRPGGLGTYLMQEIMDDCEYQHVEGAAGNLLRMRKRIT